MQSGHTIVVHVAEDRALAGRLTGVIGRYTSVESYEVGAILVEQRSKSSVSGRRLPPQEDPGLSATLSGAGSVILLFSSSFGELASETFASILEQLPARRAIVYVDSGAGNPTWFVAEPFALIAGPLDLLDDDQLTAELESIGRWTAGPDAAEAARLDSFETLLSQFPLFQATREILSAAGGLAASASPEAPLSLDLLLIALADRGQRGKVTFWGADFLRQAVSVRPGEYEHYRSATFERLGIHGVPQSSKEAAPRWSQPELTQVMSRARDYALRTTGKEEIRVRHLLAGIFLAPSDNVPFLAELGVDLPWIREKFFDWLKGYGDDDAVWRRLLVGAGPAPRQLASYDTDQARGIDLLDIESDVRALAALIAA
jgi:hypothetical protein